MVGKRSDDQHSMLVCEIDFRVGGAWHFVGRGPRGGHGFHGIYHEIDAPERVVFLRSTTRSPMTGRS